MEPPLPPPPPPRSPAEGREGSAPRQDPPLRPPPATSTPSLAPSPAPRALPLNGSESAKEGETGRHPPARVGGGAERSAEPPPPRGTVPGAASRWRCGRGGARGGDGVCARVSRAPPRGRAGPGAGTSGSRRGPRTLVGRPLPLCPRVWARPRGSHPPRGARGPSEGAAGAAGQVGTGLEFPGCRCCPSRPGGGRPPRVGRTPIERCRPPARRPPGRTRGGQVGAGCPRGTLPASERTNGKVCRPRGRPQLAHRPGCESVPSDAGRRAARGFHTRSRRLLRGPFRGAGPGAPAPPPACTPDSSPRGAEASAEGVRATRRRAPRGRARFGSFCCARAGGEALAPPTTPPRRAPGTREAPAGGVGARDPGPPGVDLHRVAPLEVFRCPITPEEFECLALRTG